MSSHLSSPLKEIEIVVVAAPEVASVPEPAVVVEAPILVVLEDDPTPPHSQIQTEPDQVVAESGEFIFFYVGGSGSP